MIAQNVEGRVLEYEGMRLELTPTGGSRWRKVNGGEFKELEFSCRLTDSKGRVGFDITYHFGRALYETGAVAETNVLSFMTAGMGEISALGAKQYAHYSTEETTFLRENSYELTMWILQLNKWIPGQYKEYKELSKLYEKEDFRPNR